MSKCMEIETEYSKLSNSSTYRVTLEVSSNCMIEYTEMETCAVVTQNMQSAKLAEGIVLLFIILLKYPNGPSKWG